MGKQFLLDPTLALAMKILDIDQHLGDFIEFFHTPSSMVKIREFIRAITNIVDKRGA